jgi:hypothetical protein
MKFNVASLILVALLVSSVVCGAQTEPAPEGATSSVLQAFQSHNIVMLGEVHIRVAHKDRIDLVYNGKAIDPGLTVAQAGLQPLDRFDVIWRGKL